jgi:predicted ester cyclase
VSTVTRTLFERAGEIVITGRPIEAIPEVFTDDVSGWSPNFAVDSQKALVDVLLDRQDALTNMMWEIDSFDIIGEKVIAEWRLEADHSGLFQVGDDHRFPATGRRVRLAGATFVQVRDDKISAFRNYFDDAALLEQLFLPDEDIKPWAQPIL